MTVELWHISPTRKAVPDGQWSIWRNPVTDESGVIHPQITVANARIAVVVRDALNALGGSRPALAGSGDWYPVVWQREDTLDAVRIERMVSPYYVGERFAVRWHGSCLSIGGEWEYEPLPSSRDDEFYARCRFATFASAVDAAGRVSRDQETKK